MSSSEELGVVIINPGDLHDSPPHTPAYEELREVVTPAVAKLNIDRAAKKHLGQRL